MLTTEDKVIICGIDISTYNCNKSNRFDKNEFQNSVIDKHIKTLPMLKEYEHYLWGYGHILLEEKENEDINNKYIHGIELLENAKFLITNNSLRIRVLSRGKRNESVFFNERRYIDALLAEINKELKELGFNKIDLEFFEALTELKNKINKEWVDRKILCIRNNFPNESELVHSMHLQKAYMKNFARTYSVTDDGFIEKKINELKTSIDELGENCSSHIILHKSIMILSLLLRVDEYIQTYSEKRKSIDDISLSNSACNFIYDFLLFFSIYDNYISNKNTTKPHNRIRNLYRNFPKKGINEYKQFERLKFILDIAVMKNSRTGLFYT